MESKSSAHFEKLAINFAEAHNNRHHVQAGNVLHDDHDNLYLKVLSDDYYIEKERFFWIKNTSEKETVKFLGLNYDKIFNEIKETYKEKNGKNWDQRKGPGVGQQEIFKEMVVNTKSTTTEKDMEKLCINLEKMGIKILEVSVHNDEGHIDKNNNMKHNYHAHIIFANCDENSKVKRWQLKDMKKLQDVVAESLEMERGERGSKVKRLSSAQYKEQAQKLDKQERKFDKALQLEKDCKIEAWGRSDHNFKQMCKLEEEVTQLKAENIELKSDNINIKANNNELEELFKAIGLDKIAFDDTLSQKDKIRLLNQEIEAKYKQDREELKNSQVATQKDYKELKEEKEEIKATVKTFVKKQDQIDIG